MAQNCDYCQKEFITNRKNKRFCSKNCRIFGYRWENNKPKIPYKLSFNDDVTLLYQIASDVQKLYKYGNFVSEGVMKAIELGHFAVIPPNEKKYLTNIWNKFYKKR